MKSLNKIFALGATLAFMLSVAAPASAAWTVPSGNPPAGNVTAPLNVSSTFQTKTGGVDIATVATRLLWSSPSTADLNAGFASGLCSLSSFFCVAKAGGTGAKGLSVSSAGDIQISDGTAATAGRILTQNANGTVSWGAAPTQQQAETLPTGTNTQTLRHNGTTWIANSTLTNDGSLVSAARLQVRPAASDTAPTYAMMAGEAVLTAINAQGTSKWSQLSQLYVKNPACSAEDDYGGGLSLSPSCRASACVAFNNTQSFGANDFAKCLPVSNGNFVAPSALTPPYGCGTSSFQLQINQGTQTCQNIPAGYMVLK